MSKEQGGKLTNMKGDKEKDECKVCKDLVAENHKGINCDICEYWYHCKCIEMEGTAYKIYKNENLPWVCSSCIKSGKEEHDLRELITKLIGEKETDKEERFLMMNMLKKLVDQVSNLDKIMEGKMKLMNDRIEKK